MSITREDYKKFVTSAPATQREFRSLEIGPAGSNPAIFFVQDGIDRTLEGQLYKASSMKITEPSESGDGDQVLTVNLGAVGNEVKDFIALITPSQRLTPVPLIYRKYYSGDLSAPVQTLTLSVGTLSYDSYNAVSFTGEDTDFINKASGEIFTLSRFPGLRGI